MRKALVIGIDYYEHASPLKGCVNDAHQVSQVLERNSNGTRNFEIRRLTGTGQRDTVSKSELREASKQLFEDDSDVALFYFAGHGDISDTGGYLICSDTDETDDGMALADILILANKSPAKSKIIILDSCLSGVAGDYPSNPDAAVLSEGITILTACASNQYAEEVGGKGVFTSLLVDALNGAAANLVGEVTPGSVYAHIDQSLGAWQQRPIFKTNVKTFVSLRETQAPINLADLRKITDLFSFPGYEFDLDPSFEPESSMPNEENTKKFAILQKYNRLNLVVPIDEEHMYFAAMRNKSCKLTVLGEHYWNLVKNGQI